MARTKPQKGTKTTNSPVLLAPDIPSKNITADINNQSGTLFPPNPYPNQTVGIDTTWESHYPSTNSYFNAYNLAGTRMELEEFLALSKALEPHHEIFYALWELGMPRFSTEKTKTACVASDQSGYFVDFYINPDFWKPLDPYTRAFLVAHECLHVVFNHGARCRAMKTPQELELANIAQDIVINHLLVDRFNFDRSRVSIAKDGCWIDTVFPDPSEVLTNQNFEYYFNLLKQKHPHTKENPNNFSDHTQLTGLIADEVIRQLNESLDNDQKNAIKDILEKNTAPLEQRELPNNFSVDHIPKSKAGLGAGGWTFIEHEARSFKRKWETIIRNWAQKSLKTKTLTQEQFTRRPRRIPNLSPEFFLPADVDTEIPDKSRITVYFYLDTSGSCWHLKNRFFKAARSLPPDRFDVRLFCFDTEVYETSLKSNRIYGGGGTAFDILAEHAKMADKVYPKAIFVITDGEGTRMNIDDKLRSRWHWFLSEDCTYLIPRGCRIYKLSDFE